ncbi:MAG: hypothetical protein HY077_10905 [Elusimicrobia bacterium]|nr:hypothetical protein [Elusimicrobiota bacterium]
MAVAASVYGPPLFVSFNASWIRILPISRKMLAAFAILFCASATALGFAATAAVAWIFAFVNGAPVAAIEKALAVIRQDSRHPDLVDWAMNLGCLSVIVSFWVFPLVRRLIGGFGATPNYRAPSAARYRIVVWALVSGGGLLAFILRGYLFSGFGFFMMAMAWLVAAGSLTAKGLGLCGRSARQWRLAAAVIACAQLGFISKVAWSQLRSSNYRARAQASDFLQWWAGLASPAQSTKPSFAQVIAQQPDLASLYSVVAAFDPAQLHSDDIKILYEHVRPKTVRMESGYCFSCQLVSADLDMNDMIAFLDSKNESLSHYALIRARYYRDERYIAVILRNLGTYAEYEKDDALVTLSILTGEYRGYEFYADWKRGAVKEPLHLRAVDCKAVEAKPLEKLEPRDEGALNICLRQTLRLPDADTVSWMEREWVQVPLSDYGKYYVRAALKHRR